MKSIFSLLLLINFSWGYSQSLTKNNSSQKFIFSINNNSNERNPYLNTEFTSSISYSYTSNKNFSSVKEINKEFVGKLNKFNPFLLQSISFGWSDFNFYFQFDMLASMWFVMQNKNFIQEQKQLFK